MSSTDGDGGFLSRWSQRKTLARQGVAPPTEPAAATGVGTGACARRDSDGGDHRQPGGGAAARAASAVRVPGGDAPRDERPPPPTLADVAALTRDSDYSRFVAPDVDGEVKNAALKKLFGDPRFNVMDGLDVYIDDYCKPDPLPGLDARQMAQAAFLGLVDAEPPKARPAAPRCGEPAADPATLSADVCPGRQQQRELRCDP